MALALLVVLGLGVIVPISILFYWLAVRSRKSYVCPNCGAGTHVEHMNAERCIQCGTPLRQVDH